MYRHEMTFYQQNFKTIVFWYQKPKMLKNINTIALIGQFKVLSWILNVFFFFFFFLFFFFTENKHFSKFLAETLAKGPEERATVLENDQVSFFICQEISTAGQYLYENFVLAYMVIVLKFQTPKRKNTRAKGSNKFCKGPPKQNCLLPSQNVLVFSFSKLRIYCTEF